MKPGVMKQQVSGLQFSRQGFSRQGFSRQGFGGQDVSREELLPQDNPQHGGRLPRVDVEALQPELDATALAPQGLTNPSSDARKPKKRAPVVRISDPVQALLQLVALIIVMIAIGYYIVVYKPGVPSQGVREISAIQHARDNKQSGFFSSLLP